MPASYRPACDKPCKECPFRRKAMPGWLGRGTPQSFVIEISLERPLPCHLTIDYEDKNWLKKWEGQRIGSICAGSLIMSANMAKLPRDPGFPRMKSDHDLVFSSPHEFITHHENAQVRSWESDDSYEIRSEADRRELDLGHRSGPVLASTPMTGREARTPTRRKEPRRRDDKTAVRTKR